MPMSISVRPYLLALVGFACTLQAAMAGEVLLDPWKCPGTMARIAADPGKELRGISRVHLLVFSNGQALYPTRVEPFAQAALPGGESLLNRCTEACERAGIPVYWAVELLRWERDDVPASGVFRKVPEWVEVDQKGRSGAGQDACRYASPFHPGVSSALLALLAEMAARRPAPVGVTLCSRLSPYEMLGYSDMARVSYIRAEAQDPVDLQGAGVAQWWRWRAARMDDVIKQAINTLKTKAPNLRIAAWATANYMVKTADVRARTADEWLPWLVEGLVSDCVLDTQWTLPWNARTWQILGRLSRQVTGERVPQPDEPPPLGAVAHPSTGGGTAVGQTKVARPPSQTLLSNMHPLVRTRDRNGQPCFERQIQELVRQGVRPAQVVIYPMTDEDWARITAASSNSGAGTGSSSAQHREP